MTSTDTSTSHVENDQKFISDENLPFSAPPAITSPNGELEAGICVMAGSFVWFCCFGLTNASGVFQTYYEVHSSQTTANSSTIAWIASFE
ncbi:hypothetical protein BZG36_05398, partial [Bifiguratus adelaidae]